MPRESSLLCGAKCEPKCSDPDSLEYEDFNSRFADYKSEEQIMGGTTVDNQRKSIMIKNIRQ